MEKSILIFNPKIARLLVKEGCKIIDIKPQKENTDKTIFIFEKNNKLLSILEDQK